jgi:phosphoglycerate dehydrogenase-like enzyme
VVNRPVVANQLGALVASEIVAAHPQATVIDCAPGAEWVVDGVEPEVALAFSRERARLLDLCSPSLRWIHLCGAGADGLPAELFADGRMVTSSKGASSVPISEFVMASVLAYEKRLPLTWVREPPPPAPRRPPDYRPEPDPAGWDPPSAWSTAGLGVLPGKTLGLLGYGGIGRAVAVRAAAFGMRVLALRRNADRGAEGAELARDLPELMARSDHLVLAAPATPRTRHIIDAEALSMAKPWLHLVNISRGSLVDQDALRSALADGRIAFASLDVADPEPPPPGHWLYSHPRVHLSPHVSYSIAGYWAAAPVALFLENLERYLTDRELVGIVDPTEGY